MFNGLALQRVINRPARRSGKHMKKTKLFVVCSSVGRTMRGFESFAVETSEELSKFEKLEVTLFKGKGEATRHSVALPSLLHDSPVTRRFASLSRRDPEFIEQLTYFFFLAPRLHRADVVLCSDGYMTSLMWFWRRLTKAKYKILFSNGGPTIPPFTRQDHMHQVAPYYLEMALEAGIAAENQTLLPYGIKMMPETAPLSLARRSASHLEASPRPSDRDLGGRAQQGTQAHGLPDPRSRDSACSTPLPAFGRASHR